MKDTGFALSGAENLTSSSHAHLSDAAACLERAANAAFGGRTGMPAAPFCRHHAVAVAGEVEAALLLIQKAGFRFNDESE